MSTKKLRNLSIYALRIRLAKAQKSGQGDTTTGRRLQRHLQRAISETASTIDRKRAS